MREALIPIALDMRAYGFPSSAKAALQPDPPEDSERHYYKRKEWPPGPWHNEPFDYVWWEAHGVTCLMVRNGMGGWCGYAGVRPEHPFYGIDYRQCVLGHKNTPLKVEIQKYRRKRELAKSAEERRIWDSVSRMTAIDKTEDASCKKYEHMPQSILNAHGGTTYSRLEKDGYWIQRLELTEPALYFYGFDCGHSQDVLPGMLVNSKQMRERLAGDASAVGLFTDHLDYDPATGAITKYGLPSRYRDYAYVKQETEELAEQLEAAGRYKWRKVPLPTKPPLGQRMKVKRQRQAIDAPAAEAQELGIYDSL